MMSTDHRSDRYPNTEETKGSWGVCRYCKKHLKTLYFPLSHPCATCPLNDRWFSLLVCQLAEASCRVHAFTVVSALTRWAGTEIRSATLQLNIFSLVGWVVCTGSRRREIEVRDTCIIRSSRWTSHDTPLNVKKVP